MKYISAVLTLVLLSLTMVACQTSSSPTAVNEPTETPTFTPESIINAASGLPGTSMITQSLEQESVETQASYCYYPGTFNGYTGCLGYDFDAAFYYYVWPWGYGFNDCYVTVYTTAGWTDWIYINDYNSCNL